MRPFVAFTRSPISLIGSAVTTVSAILFLTIFLVEQLGFQGGPYLGILAFLIIPAVFVFGLLLIPLGIWRQRVKDRKRAAMGGPLPSAPIIDLNLPRTRKIAFVILILTIVNIAIIATATYKGVEVMDSTQFCGGACHSVMNPEFTTYQRSPHARVRCTECHIGSGADWFVKSKISGSWQLISVLFNLYPRPIPTPVHSLRSAQQTCEQCHWPSKSLGDQLRIHTRFASDEKQTEKKTVLLLNTGSGERGKGHGIHWHVDPSHQIRYRSDPSRRQIYDVELTNPNGALKLFTASAPPAPGNVDATWKTMDCVDCHNRPTHIYRLPNDELDAALEAKELDRSLPYLKREGMRALELKLASHEDARTGIRKALFDSYGKDYPDLVKTEPERIEAAANTLWNIYRRNVFPQMNITWGTYPIFAEHTGCFRCHDKQHQTQSGEKISQSCELCHQTLATEEANPEILQLLYP